jgi:hypothetical protein
MRNYYEAHLTKELPSRLQAALKKLDEELPNKDSVALRDQT